MKEYMESFDVSRDNARDKQLSISEDQKSKGKLATMDYLKVAIQRCVKVYTLISSDNGGLESG